jgi:hypothetical protein
MSEVGKGESSRREPTSQNQNLLEQWIPHERLVESFRSLIKEHQATHEMLYGGMVLPPETVVRDVLNWYSDSSNKEQSEIFHTLGYAWDVLAYDRYEVGSKAEHMAGESLSIYYNAPDHPSAAITLTHPMQVRILDALAEAAGVPHTKGQTAFEIPEKLRNYSHYLMSAEYLGRWEQAKARRKK